MDVGEAVVAALEAEGEAFVVDAEEVKQGGVEVVDMDGGLDGAEAEVVGAADDLAAGDAAACEPHGEGLDVVVPSGLVAGLAHGGASELAAPDDDG